MPFQVTREFSIKTLPHRLVLKGMSRVNGEEYLDRYLPELTDDERQYMLDLCGRSLQPVFVQEDNDPLFCAAMFMVGVSQGDLALLFGVRRQTIQQKIYRQTTKSERDTLRVVQDRIDLEAVQLCRDIFRLAQRDDRRAWDNKAPVEIGRHLITAANAVIARDRGDEPLPDRPRRYSNLHISQDSKQAAAEIVEQVKQEHPEIVAHPTGPVEPLPGGVAPLAPSTDPNAAQRVIEADKAAQDALTDFLGG